MNYSQKTRKHLANDSLDKPISDSPDQNPPAVQWVTVQEDSVGQRIDNFLFKLLKGVPKSHLYKAMRSGEIRVNKKRVTAEYRLQVEDLLRIPPMRVPVRTERFVPALEFPIVFEDDAVLVIDKPAGVAVHGGSGVSFGVIEQLRKARPQAKFLELVHRLDRDTSGLLMLAKKRSALVGLHQGLRDGHWSKSYLALVYGDWVNQRQHIKKPLLKWLTQEGERRVRVDEGGQFAHTIVSSEERFGAFSLVKAELKTGRTHQIRVHLASMGHAIVGDDKYASDEENHQVRHLGYKRMFLHAAELAFEHPLTGQKVSVQAPLPKECLDFLAYLRTR